MVKKNGASVDSVGCAGTGGAISTDDEVIGDPLPRDSRYEKEYAGAAPKAKTAAMENFMMLVVRGVL